MVLRIRPKTLIAIAAMAAIATLLSGDALAHGHHHGGGGGGGGSVPEIGAGTAGCALAFLLSSAYLLKDQLLGTRKDKATEQDVVKEDQDQVL